VELTESNMSERQRSYREVYRQRIAAWYNGYLHVAIIYSIGFGALFVYASHLQQTLWWEWLTLPLVLFVSNLFEWWIHRHVMHRPRSNSGARAIYTRHMLMHHQFFTDSEMRFADQLDWRVTFFPPYALIVFILMTTPAALVVGWLVTPNVAWLMMMASTSIYLIYEFMHFCCHVNESWFVRYCPLVNTIRRHHEAHHNQSIMMERNMNLTLPIADWLFGTSDLNRGLLGHIFNGYDKRYIKTDMRKTSSAPSVTTATSTAAVPISAS
jgi:hypothetical protein